MRFAPELGQALFSNTPWADEPLDGRVRRVIEGLGEMLEETGLAVDDPCSNTGARYEGPVFSMRAYCWCDGERHPQGCPANFEYGDFKAYWYKHSRRGATQSKTLTTEEVIAMRRTCEDSILKEKDD